MNKSLDAEIEITNLTTPLYHKYKGDYWEALVSLGERAQEILDNTDNFKKLLLKED